MLPYLAETSFIILSITSLEKIGIPLYKRIDFSLLESHEVSVCRSFLSWPSRFCSITNISCASMNFSTSSENGNAYSEVIKIMSVFRHEISYLLNRIIATPNAENRHICFLFEIFDWAWNNDLAVSI